MYAIALQRVDAAQRTRIEHLRTHREMRHQCRKPVDLMNTTTRTFAASTLAITLQASVTAHAAQPETSAHIATSATLDGNYIVTADGVRLYYKDWGSKDGPVVTFSHGWPLSSDSWESQMVFLADQGYRVVAHDRRGHGRSS